MEELEEFLSQFPMKRERGLTAVELTTLKKSGAPKVVLDVLTKLGVASSRNFYFTVLPQTQHEVLRAWGIDPSNAFVFLRTAFGTLVFASGAELFSLDPTCGFVQAIKSTIAWTFMAMDSFTEFEEFETRGLEKRLLEPSQMLALVPPVKLGGSWSTSKLVKKPLEKHLQYLAGLYGSKAKNTPRQLVLSANPTAAPKKKTTAPAAKSPFADAALHWLVVGALWKSKKLKADEIRRAVASVSATDDDDEDGRIEAALRALMSLPLDAKSLATVGTLQRLPAFEVFFEGLIDAETGGEADYMYPASLKGIEQLPALETLDLRGIATTRKPDLAPLNKHPTLAEVIVPKVFDKKALGALPKAVKVTTRA